MLINFWDIFCLYAPWHKWKVIERLSRDCQKIECQYCHRMFSMNNHVKVVLPWDEVKDFYCH